MESLAIHVSEFKIVFSLDHLKNTCVNMLSRIVQNVNWILKKVNNKIFQLIDFPT